VTTEHIIIMGLCGLILVLLAGSDILWNRANKASKDLEKSTTGRVTAIKNLAIEKALNKDLKADLIVKQRAIRILNREVDSRDNIDRCCKVEIPKREYEKMTTDDLTDLYLDMVSRNRREIKEK